MKRNMFPSSNKTINIANRATSTRHQRPNANFSTRSNQSDISSKPASPPTTSTDNLQLQPSPSKSPSSTTFRIDHLIPTSSSSGIIIKRESPKPQRPGVYVMQFTPKHTKTQSITTEALISVASRQEFMARAHCTLAENGQILMITPEIMRKIKLAEDVHSHNALFEWHNGLTHLRIVRDLQKDEEIVAWFSEDVTLLMGIPFLIPLNIQGNNRYTCHICRLTFETPNPLKIHLALNCGHHTIDILWLRLHYATKARQHSNVYPFSSVIRPAESTSLSAINQISSVRASEQVPRLSAFKPVPNSTTTTITAVPVTTSSTAAGALLTPQLTSHISSNLPFIPNILPHMQFLQPTSSNALNAAAQIEAIVSNMGASKQGHLCIYCGKMYSRKYGLKIHIRTHTGFKPLKCKYCLRPFGDPSNLNKHVRLHMQSNVPNSMVESYECQLCHKITARRRELQRHLETRHGARSEPSPSDATAE